MAMLVCNVSWKAAAPAVGAELVSAQGGHKVRPYEDAAWKAALPGRKHGGLRYW